MFHVKHFGVNMKKVITIILLILAFSLLSCANVSHRARQNEEESKTKTEEIKESLPKTQEFAGQSLVIYADDPADFIYDESRIGSVKTAVSNRNEVLSSLYAVSLSVSQVPESKIAEELKKAETAGISTAHILAYSASKSVSLMTNGYLTSISSLPNFDSYLANVGAYTPNSLSIGNKIYLLPDPSALYYDNVLCLFCNLDLISQTGMLNPVDLAKKGEWNDAKFKSYAETIAYSVMNKSSYDSSTDIFGFGCADDTALESQFCQAACISLIESKNTVSYAYTPDQLSAECAVLKDIMQSKARAPYSGSEAEKAFLQGRLGFYTTNTSFLQLLCEKHMDNSLPFQYAILPLPCKEGNFYRSPIDSDGLVFAVPSSTPSKSLSGLGITAIGAAGGEAMLQSAIDTYITLYSFNNDQSSMIDIILRSAAYDFGYVYGTEIPAIRNVTTSMLKDTLTTGVSFSGALRSKMEKFNDYVQANF